MFLGGASVAPAGDQLKRSLTNTACSSSFAAVTKLFWGRQGQRSVRLNRAYRAIYVEHETGEVELIEVLEVNKHEYR